MTNDGFTQDFERHCAECEVVVVVRIEQSRTDRQMAFDFSGYAVSETVAGQPLQRDADAQPARPWRGCVGR